MKILITRFEEKKNKCLIDFVVEDLRLFCDH